MGSKKPTITKRNKQQKEEASYGRDLIVRCYTKKTETGLVGATDNAMHHLQSYL